MGGDGIVSPHGKPPLLLRASAFLAALVLVPCGFLLVFGIVVLLGQACSSKVRPQTFVNTTGAPASQLSLTVGGSSGVVLLTNAPHCPQPTIQARAANPVVIVSWPQPCVAPHDRVKLRFPPDYDGPDDHIAEWHWLP